MIISLLKLSEVFLKEAKSRWKEEGYEREDPYFDQVKYDQYLEEVSKDKKPVDNKIIGDYRVLLKYINDPNVFITFSDYPILSTNYSSYFGSKKKYNTPAGFYSYPIVELVDRTTDFAKDSRYAIATRFHGNLLVSNKYTEEDLYKDLEILGKEYPEIYEEVKTITNETTYRLKLSTDAKVKTPAGILFYYIWKLSEKNFSRFSTIFLKLGYQGFYDTGDKIIHGHEPRQALFFTPKTSLEVLGIFKAEIDYESISLKVRRDYIDIAPEEYLIKLVSKDGYKLRSIKNPSEEVKKAAVHNEPKVIQFIKNPSEEVQVIAVAKWAPVLVYIENPSEQIQILAIKKYPSTIKFIKNPTEEAQLLAIRRDPYSFKLIEDPTQKVKDLMKKEYPNLKYLWDENYDEKSDPIYNYDPLED